MGLMLFIQAEEKHLKGAEVQAFVYFLFTLLLRYARTLTVVWLKITHCSSFSHRQSEKSLKRRSCGNLQRHLSAGWMQQHGGEDTRSP